MENVLRGPGVALSRDAPATFWDGSAVLAELAFWIEQLIQSIRAS